MYAILNLVSNTIMTGFAFVGIGTVIIKVGSFFKIIEENKEDGFKKGFDAIMLESIDEVNTCVESLSIITSNFNKIFFTIYDILIGNKFIKKDKDGKIIICNKTKLYSGFKDKIEELNNKVKKYQQELNKIKKDDKDDKKNKDDNDNDNENDDNDDNDNNDKEEIHSDVSSNELSDDEYCLE
jgi:hypothetical protein